MKLSSTKTSGYLNKNDTSYFPKHFFFFSPFFWGGGGVEEHEL